jgi:hypothetical protein
MQKGGVVEEEGEGMENDERDKREIGGGGGKRKGQGDQREQRETRERERKESGTVEESTGASARSMDLLHDAPQTGGQEYMYHTWWGDPGQCGEIHTGAGYSSPKLPYTVTNLHLSRMGTWPLAERGKSACP